MQPVSIIVPAYNTSDYIVETLESIRDQSLPPGEVIVVNDGSTDDTVDVVERWADANGINLRLVSKPNGGAASARNRGVEEAAGEWILFLDSDDLLAPDALETLIDTATKYPDCGWIGGDLAVVNQFGNPEGFQSLRERPNTTALLADAFETDAPLLLARPWRIFLEVCVPATGTGIIRREAALAAGAMNETLRHSEDYQYFIRLARHSDYVFVPKVIKRYRQRPDSLTAEDFPPHLWTVKAFRQLISLYGLPASDKTLRSRLADFETQNSYYYRTRGRYGAALRSALASVRWRPVRAAGWRALLASLARPLIDAVRSDRH